MLAWKIISVHSIIFTKQMISTDMDLTSSKLKDFSHGRSDLNMVSGLNIFMSEQNHQVSKHKHVTITINASIDPHDCYKLSIRLNSTELNGYIYIMCACQF